MNRFRLVPIVFFVLALFFFPQALFAQGNGNNSDSVVVNEDSLKNIALIENTKYLARLDSIKRVDSLKRVALETQLNDLKTTDNIKKQELLKQLDDIKAAQQEVVRRRKEKVDSLKQFVKGFPVIMVSDTLFYLYSTLGPYTPQARANSIDEKLDELKSDPFFNADSLLVIASDETVDIWYKDVVILSVTDKDAIWLGQSKDNLANQYRVKIISGIATYKKATSVQTILLEIGQAILVIIIVIVLIHYLNKGYKWLLLNIYKGRNSWVKGIRIRNYELFTAASQVRAMKIVLNVLRLLVILLIISFSLPVLFDIFPWTKSIADTMYGYILTPIKKIITGIWNYLPNLITIIVIVLVFKYVNKGIKFLKDEVKTGALHIPGFYPDWATPTYQIIRILMFAFMVIVIFPYLPGSDSPVFRGVSVFLGVLFTFGSSGSLSNIVAGLVLTYMRAFKIGDRVKIGDVTGDIVEKNLLVTRIRTIKNEDITIPNASVMNNHTTNFTSASRKLGLIVHSTVTIGYDVPWRMVHELLINAANETDMIQQYPKPFVLQTSLDDYYVSYQINAYTKMPAKQAVIYSLLHQNIQDKFNEAGVEIMSPHYQTLRDGNATTIPPDYLPDDYVPPPFNVQSNNQK